MKKSKTLALSMTAIGIILAIAGPFLPGGIHLMPNDPPRSGHVTVLTTTAAGDVLAGTQTGEIWRLHGGIWTQERIYLGGNPVMAILGEPGRAPVGTAAGLYNGPVGAAALEGRVGSLLQTNQGLIAGTPEGVRLLTGGRWQTPGPKANVYTLFKQEGDGSAWLHAATVGDGVLSAPAGDPATPWRPNSLGLPEGSNVFSFAATPGGRLLAGTNQGLYWQARPGETWRLLHPALADTRILALHLAPRDGSGGSERLWMGGDQGLSWLDLSEQSGDLTALDQPTAADSPEYQPPVGISWILSHDDHLMLSAGAVYQLSPTQMTGWYWVSIAGLVLILLAAWWMPQPPPVLVRHTTERPASSPEDPA
ncbi:ABC transporter substrate-binding protein [Thiocystis violacea]|uniref:ABC transporter substrate-binding protein n=1 Tax=Thiocystis violacea TaxID=13725 RepID=UPI0019066EB8|nr:ABC transporter substrate-binding protein [Thiocystis violacea]MBK1722167.1 ABC transporter substrate-binding protein [Thiocystis violacea]